MPPDVEALACDWCHQNHVEEDGTQSVDVVYCTNTDQAVCEDCMQDLVSCERCEYIVTPDETTYGRVIGHGELLLCDPCMNDTIYCEVCGDRGFDSHYFCSTPYGDILCEACYDDRGGSDLIESWNYQPPFQLISTEDEFQSETYYFGLELETDHVDERDVAQAINDNVPNAYCKSDGSLSCGVEIVTHPGTLRAWQTGKVIPWNVWPHVSDSFQGMASEENAGIHIHVSRTAFERNGTWSAAHLWKFLQLHYRNSYAFARLAGRMGSSYASWNPVDDRFKAKKNSRKHDDDDRYRVINVNNDATVECRYFQADERKEVILSNIELVHAAVEYTRDLDATDVRGGALDYRAFYIWYAARSGTYPNLCNTTREQGPVMAFIETCAAYAERDDVAVKELIDEKRRRLEAMAHVYRAFNLLPPRAIDELPPYSEFYPSTDYRTEAVVDSLFRNNQAYLRYTISGSGTIRDAIHNIVREITGSVTRGRYRGYDWEDRDYYGNVVSDGPAWSRYWLWTALELATGIAHRLTVRLTDDDLYWLSYRLLAGMNEWNVSDITGSFDEMRARYREIEIA